VSSLFLKHVRRQCPLKKLTSLYEELFGAVRADAVNLEVTGSMVDAFFVGWDV
jgi:hypothetical protein